MRRSRQQEITMDKNIKILIPEALPEWTDRIHNGPMKAVWNRETEDLPTLELTPPQRGLKSEFIDGAWYWVVGCEKCLGTSNGWDYFVCDEHNVCVDCQTHRSEIVGSAWGTREGFRCSPCQTALDQKLKREALEKVASNDYDEWDYKHNDEIVCPHCGTSYEPDEPRDGKETCDICGGEYELEIEYSVTYSTTVVGERITLDSLEIE